MSLIGIIMFVKFCLSECTDDDTERRALIFIVSIELKALLEKNCVISLYNALIVIMADFLALFADSEELQRGCLGH